MSYQGFARSLIVLASLSVTGTSFAAPSLPEREPGLWEMTLSQNSPLGDMLKSTQEAMKHMPEAERMKMEEIMKQSGMTSGQPNVIRECLTPEMAKREFQPSMDDPEMKCSDMKWSGSRSGGTYTMTCTNADGKWELRGRIWDATAKSYKSSMVMTGVVEGRAMNMEIAHEAKWVSSDCRGVAPRE